MKSSRLNPGEKGLFIFGSLTIAATLIYWLIISTIAPVKYYLSVAEYDAVLSEGNTNAVKVSGVVIGHSIHIDEENSVITFEIADMPVDSRQIEAQGGISAVLEEAASDPTRKKMRIRYQGKKPDLLLHQAQAIVTGRMSSDGLFHADELFLRCRTNYEASSTERANMPFFGSVIKSNLAYHLDKGVHDLGIEVLPG